MSARQQGGGAQIAHGQIDLPGQAQRLTAVQRLHIDDSPLKLESSQCLDHEATVMEAFDIAGNLTRRQLLNTFMARHPVVWTGHTMPPHRDTDVTFYKGLYESLLWRAGVLFPALKK